MAGDEDVAIIEIGGTVGDIEGQPFLEAIRQMRSDLGKENVLYIHLTLVPYMRVAGELKTKPTQHSVKELRSIGIQPDIIICRSEVVLNREIRKRSPCSATWTRMPCFAPWMSKTSTRCRSTSITRGGPENRILLRLPAKNAKLDSWRDLICRLANPKKTVTIGIVGKYVDLKEAYKSLHEALVHGGVANEAAVELVYVNSENVTAQNVAEKLAGVDGVLVPGGFGSRGIEGKIAAIAFARGNRIPFFGICLGMQCAVIEFARNVLGLEGANSEEFDVTTPHPVIYLMKEWFDFRSKKIERREADGDMGGTMRLGAYPCSVRPDTRAYAAYGELEISERHRHRYEFNKVYAKQFEEAGLGFRGLSPDGERVEIVELTDHPWFLGCQFHPEFKSNPMRPHPLFREFIRAAVELREARDGKGKNDACPPCPAVSA